jgi:beta-lactam-binding protein with PASTA domain
MPTAPCEGANLHRALLSASVLAALLLAALAPGALARDAYVANFGSNAGPASCRVPRVAGLTVQEARGKLERAGCRLGARHPKHLGPKAVVIATSPQAGGLLPFGTRISLFLRIR